MESPQNRQFHLITASFFGLDWVFRAQVRIGAIVPYLYWLFPEQSPRRFLFRLKDSDRPHLSILADAKPEKSYWFPAS